MSGVPVVHLVDEGAVLLYLARLPDDREELLQVQAELRQERTKAEAAVVKYDRLQARCTTREGIRRNANRAGRSILQAHDKDVQLEAVHRRLLEVTGEEEGS